MNDPPDGSVLPNGPCGRHEQGEQLDREQDQGAHEGDQPLLADRRALDAQRAVDEEDEQHGERVLEVGERAPEEERDEREAEQHEPRADAPG